MSSRQVALDSGKIAISDIEKLAKHLGISIYEPLSDFNVVKLLEYQIAASGNVLRHITDIDKFVIWNEKYKKWIEADKKEQFGLMQQAYAQLQIMFQRMVEEKIKADKANSPEDTQVVKSRRDWNKCPLGVVFAGALTQSRVEGYLKCLASQSEYIVLDDEFGTNPEVITITTKSGCGLVVDLATLQLRLAAKEDKIKLFTNIILSDEGQQLAGYLEDAKMEWLKGSITGKITSHLWPKGDEAYARHAQMCLGYALRGDNVKQKLFLFHGATRTGKSALTDAILLLLGDYAMPMAADVLLEGAKSNTENTYQLGHLPKKRYVKVTEPKNKQAVMTQSFVNTVTGEVKMPVRKIYGHYAFADIEATFYMPCNRLPKINDETKAVSNRIIIMRTKAATLSDGGQEGGLAVSIKANPKESEILLAWLLLGYKDWRENGFVGPEDCFGNSKQLWTATLDSITGLAEFIGKAGDETWAWVDESFTEAVKGQDIYAVYQQFCTEIMGKKTYKSMPQFYEDLKVSAFNILGRPIEKYNSGGITKFKGIRIVRGM